MDISGGLRKLFGLDTLHTEQMSQPVFGLRSAPVQAEPVDPVEAQRPEREQLLIDTLERINGRPINSGHEPLTPSVGVRG